MEPLALRKGSVLNLYTGVSLNTHFRVLRGTFLNWKDSPCDFYIHDMSISIREGYNLEMPLGLSSAVLPRSEPPISACFIYLKIHVGLVVNEHSTASKDGSKYNADITDGQQLHP
jgi:hypothetical protein